MDFQVTVNQMALLEISTLACITRSNEKRHPRLLPAAVLSTSIPSIPELELELHVIY